MATPPAFSTLRETDLGIKPGPLDGKDLQEVFRRFFALINPNLDATNKSLSKGLTLGSNLRCDTITVKATHGVSLNVKLQTLSRANSCIVTGFDTALPWPVAACQMLQPAQTGGVSMAKVTVWFNDSTATGNVRLWLFEDGLQTTTIPTFADPILKSLLTTIGDMIYASAVGVPARLAAPADGNYLAKFTSGVPSWLAQSYCAAEYNTTAAQSIPTGVITIVGFGTKVTDTDNAMTVGSGYNSATGAWTTAPKFTVPAGKAGDYDVSAVVLINGATGTDPNLYVYKNGAAYAALQDITYSAAPANGTVSGAATLTGLTAGDTLDVRLNHNAGVARALTANATQNRVTINRRFGS